LYSLIILKGNKMRIFLEAVVGAMVVFGPALVCWIIVRGF